MSIVIRSDTIVTLMSLPLYFLNNFTNLILQKWLLESDSRNIRNRNKSISHLIFNFTLVKMHSFWLLLFIISGRVARQWTKFINSEKTNETKTSAVEIVCQEIKKFISSKNTTEMKISAVEIVSKEMDKTHKKQ